MKEMRQIIREENREQLYDYYLSLGYDHKTAAVLTLFTYGQYRFSRLSMDDLYDALQKEEEYLPPEILEERKRLEKRALRFAAAAAGRAGSGARKTSIPASFGTAQMYMKSSVSVPEIKLSEEESISFGVDACAASCSAAMPSLAGNGGIPAFPDHTGAEPATDEYEPIEEKEARNSAAEPTSTFRMTTNTASAGIILNQLRNGRRIDRSMVRIEEMLNYFRYETEIPEKEMFSVSSELMDAKDQKKYLYVNVQGKEEVKDRQNIVLLLDVSGSMSGDAEQTQAVIATIVSKLGNGDRLSLITYSTKDSVELEAISINGPEDRIRVLEKLLSIEIGGCTDGSKGIERAYRIGKKNYIRGGNNQVILITDGDLNFGITDKGGLEELIERKKKDNIFLSVIGTGLYNYRDDKLVTLCKHGNGVYRTVNSLADVQKSINEEYVSLVNIIAKDVKAQVEFNPEVVESYRLLGFENRMLGRQDFTNDKVISEPFGSGGYGVALYELKMRPDGMPVESGLKYSRLVTTGSRELCTVRIRYKEPLEEVSHELEKIVETADASYTNNLRLAFIVYVCAEKLRGSDKIGADEIDLAKKLYRELGGSVRDRNAADLYKLAGILEKGKSELGIGIPEEPFVW